ncbi:MAG: FtsX-like permease family protein [Cyclobacteriaceae bacterium]|nr:hypothetical protein [Cytophagales bacterium]HNP78823.1 ABC transporter permease [Cyclobacteriaceae bacterium]
MLKNYLRIAIRNILKHKLFSFINITGLVMGMTCCLLITVYVVDELSYDRFLQGHENIYRVALDGRMSGQEFLTTNSCMPLGPAMKAEIPGIESFVRVFPGNGSTLTFRYEDKIFAESKVFYADSNFFDFFSFKLLQGDRKTALREINSVVITEALAVKYFGTEDPMGKIIVIGNRKWPCKVTGVVENAPRNSHMTYQALISYLTGEKDFWPGWTGNSIQTYVTKTPATRLEDINQGLEKLVIKNVGDELKNGLGISFEQFIKQGGKYSYFAYPIADSHLYARLPDDITPSGDIRYVYIFSGIGIFILLLACINFMNMSTAQSAGRAKEVGLRKTLGSLRGQMITQFLAESFLYSALAVVLAVALSFLLLPYFNTLAGKQLTLGALWSPLFMGAVLLIVILVGFLAGSYPALYLTSFNVVEVLKGKVRAGMKSQGVRSSLVVVQFAVSTFLIIATLVVYQQLSYMQSRNLGLDKEHVLAVSAARRLDKNRDAFKVAVDALPGVVKSSYSTSSFPGVDNITVFRQEGLDVDHLVAKYEADFDHLDVLKLELKQGRWFSRDFKTDTTACVINEAAVREFGLEDPLSEELTDFNGPVAIPVRIVGVVKDFNFESLKSKVRPLVIRLTERASNLQIRYEGDVQAVVAGVEQQWKNLAPGEPLDYTFMDQDFDELFRSEMRLKNIFTVFSSLAIFIACLGLFALAAFTTEQRTKEIGVRKALGASSASLTLLLSREFTILVLIAILPAVGLGWYVADWWLADFSYRIELTPWLFVASGLVALAIAWLTVSYQSIKAAASNPVTSLRYE